MTTIQHYNVFDYIILGGGIAGLYSAYSILKKNKKANILILEKHANVGGRVFTFKNKHMTVEAGAGRFHSEQPLILGLLKELDLEKHIIEINNTWGYGPSDGSHMIHHSIFDTPTKDNVDLNYISRLLKSGNGVDVQNDLFTFFNYELYGPMMKHGLEYYLGPHTLPCNELILQVIIKSSQYSNDELVSISFLEFARRILNDEQVEYIKNSYGYYAKLIYYNAYDAMVVMRKNLSPFNKFYALKGGLSSIIRELEKRINTYNNVVIKTLHTIEDLHFVEDTIFVDSLSDNDDGLDNNGRFNGNVHVLCNKMKQDYLGDGVGGVGGGIGGSRIINDNTKIIFSGKKCISCLPKQVLESIPFFKELSGTFLSHIHCSPLCRIYVKYPKTIQDPSHNGNKKVWFHELKGRLCVNNDLRMIIPINADEGVIMISYCDSHFARGWYDLYLRKNKKGVHNKIKKLVRRAIGIEVPDFIDLQVFYWSCGVGFWGINANSEFVSENILQPNPKYPLYICGEHFSKQNQQWIEGALETSRNVVRSL
jgi:hypothetical protein